MKMASSQSKERPPYNGQLDYGEFEYGGHQIGLRLPKEVWGYIRQVGGEGLHMVPGGGRILRNTVSGVDGLHPAPGRGPVWDSGVPEQHFRRIPARISGNQGRCPE